MHLLQVFLLVSAGAPFPAVEQLEVRDRGEELSVDTLTPDCWLHWDPCPLVPSLHSANVHHLLVVLEAPGLPSSSLQLPGSLADSGSECRSCCRVPGGGAGPVCSARLLLYRASSNPGRSTIRQALSANDVLFLPAQKLSSKVIIDGWCHVLNSMRCRNGESRWEDSRENLIET